VKRQEEKITAPENELARLKPLEAKITTIENLLAEVKNVRIGLESEK
jgi:hypothetical protein